jgi:hypothetical protein
MEYFSNIWNNITNISKLTYENSYVEMFNMKVCDYKPNIAVKIGNHVVNLSDNLDKMCKKSCSKSPEVVDYELLYEVDYKGGKICQLTGNLDSCGYSKIVGWLFPCYNCRTTTGQHKIVKIDKTIIKIYLCKECISRTFNINAEYYKIKL